MKNIFILLLLFMSLSCSPPQKEKENLAQYVNPFVGTAYVGHTFPGATYPLGFMQPGPQTGNFGWEYCSGYNYEDTHIWGFTQNHLNGTGIPDLGDILIMPYSGTPGNEYKSTFSKNSEITSPGYYAVNLIDNSVNVELSCTPHVAIHRYKFTKNTPAVYINFQSGSVSTKEQYNTRVLHADVNIEDNCTITGHHTLTGWVERELFYVIEFEKPFSVKEEIKGDPRNKAHIYVFHFNLKEEDPLHVKVAFSTVSIEGARNNLKQELAGWNFDKVRKEAEESWEELFSRITIEGSEEQKKNFYTSVYHLFIQPNNIADVDGQYRGADNKVVTSYNRKYYSTFSLWDTFRAAHPLYTIMATDHVSDMVNTMLSHADTHGFLPIWALWGKENYCMIGNHGVPVVVEACLKNLPNIDVEKTFTYVKKSLTDIRYRGEWDIYDKYGYFPYDLIKEESVSRTLECSYDDYCAALLAKKLGKEEDYEFFMKRSAYYKNLFDPDTKLMRGKNSQGQWREPFDKFHLSHAGTAGGDYTEGNAWQYTWHVLQDIDGLIDLMGGKEAFATKLDSLFILEDTSDVTGFVGDVTGLIGQYAQGNEPSHHVIYLYSLVGKNWRTAELIREVFNQFYLPHPDGLCGNDDCGQMSAWYIFSALGFYPVNPVSGEYIIGAPQIPKATINLPAGKTFTVLANNISSVNKYVKSVKLNGQVISDFKITYNQIMEGGILEFEMTDKSGSM